MRSCTMRIAIAPSPAAEAARLIAPPPHPPARARPLADGGANPLARAAAHVAGGEAPRRAGLEHQRPTRVAVPVDPWVVACVRAGQDVAAGVELHPVAQPFRVRPGADE